ncbi:universal stress protein [Massilia yuzhufengensis]|uniref:Nucleotide-binding universal stress protein, UspA family n=1 Tax=Massilia yuzhufengensis TaxID=1164594 RepID=A0A1I1ERX9_9BURK|nr:universal stress protein [Massilia yuzhufengensis]SFB89757.1 Nucleotide-binding universal stress protein, UspA family [Massilia yuzhufengensis]
MYKRILIPTDGSPVSDYAAGAAIDFAQACGSETVALSIAVPEPVLQSLEGAMVLDPGQEVDTLLRHAYQLASAIAERARTAGVACTPLTRFALDPGEAIVETARKQGCDLIVMGSHGRRGLSRLLAGSVTQSVLAYAPVPVMVLRPAPASEAAQALARECPAEAAAAKRAGGA